MTGLKKGHIRIVTSPNLRSDDLVADGLVISEAGLALTIIAQDGEVFIGFSRVSTMARGAEPIHVYGSIRSTSREGIFSLLYAVIASSGSKTTTILSTVIHHWALTVLFPTARNSDKNSRTRRSVLGCYC
jgi:hypothetical protein